MKHLGKLAVLGAVFAAAVPFASATSFSGNININDTPASASYGGPTTFSLTAVNNVPPEPFGAGNPNLSSYTGNLTLFTFTNLGSGFPTPLEMYSAQDAGGDTVAFYATGFMTAVAQNSGSGDISAEVTGYFTETSAAGPGGCTALGTCLTQTGGYDNITFNDTPSLTNGNVTEDLVATPTPEPNSLMLLGTGLVSAAGLLVRRRRTV